MRLALACRALVLALVIAGCGATGPSATAPSRTPPITPSPSIASPPPTSSPARPPSSSSAAVVVDPSLLDHLPDRIDGLDVMRQPESDAVAAQDPAVVQNGEAVITALVIDPPTGEFAYAALVRLRAGVFDDALFRQWRDTFDQGACSLAGGLAGNAVSKIADREVYIGSCEGGMLTYHVWLPGSRVVVSVSSVGERRLGEKLVQALQD